MTENPRGVQRHLDYWLYGIVKVANGLGNTRSFLRAVQEETIQKLLERNRLAFPTDGDPIELLRAYTGRLDERGILDADDVAFHRTGEHLSATIGDSCPYRSTCNWLHEDGEPLPCFRAIAMGEVLRLATGRANELRLTRFGVPCHVTFKPLSWEASDDGD